MAKQEKQLVCPNCGKQEVALEEAALVYYRIPLAEDGTILREEEEMVLSQRHSESQDTVSCQACGEFFAYRVNDGKVEMA